MKKILQALLWLIAMFTFNATVFAQFEVEWDAGVTVTLPDDFEIDKNISGEFTASADGMEFNMFIFEEDVSLEDMNEATMEIANELEVSDIHEIMNIETDSGFEGRFVEGNLDGQIIIIAGFIDPSTTTNFFVLMTLYDDDDLAIEDAAKILNSLSR